MMNFNKKSTKRTVSAIIIIFVIVAMLLPMLSYLA